MFMRNIFLIICIDLCLGSFAQSSPDYLLGIWNDTVQTDSVRWAAINKLSRKYYLYSNSKIKFDSSIVFFDKMLKIEFWAVVYAFRYGVQHTKEHHVRCPDAFWAWCTLLFDRVSLIVNQFHYLIKVSFQLHPIEYQLLYCGNAKGFDLR